MSIKRDFFPIFRLLVLCLVTTPGPASAQQSTPTPTSDDDVLRISTELVQTDVVVVDKQGRFVDGLKPDQFLLKVDGKAQPITFFERITAGTATEEKQLNSGRGPDRVSERVSGSADATIRGRTILFFVDDIHLTLESIVRVRNVLLRFIDKEMGPDDVVAIASPTGNLGFLQQFTNSKPMLRIAVTRLKFQAFTVSDSMRPSMSEFQAQAIDRGEKDVMDPFVDQTMRENPRMPRSIAEATVKQRASQILKHLRPSHLTH